MVQGGDASSVVPSSSIGGAVASTGSGMGPFGVLRPLGTRDFF